MRNKFILLSFFFLAGAIKSFGQLDQSTPLSSQTPWSLRQCIDYAVEHNINIKQQGLNVIQREIDVDKAKNQRLPNLSGSASQNWSFGRGLTADNTYTNTNTSSTSFSLGTSVPLFTGLSIPNNIELNKLNLAAATADLEKAKNDIRMQVAQAYVQILYSLELSDVAKRQVSIDSMQVARVRELYSNGKVSGAEVAQQEAAMAQSKYTATQADNDYQIALLSLSQLLELPSPEGFSVVRPDTASIRVNSDAALASPDEIYQEAVTLKPEVKAELLRLKGTEKSILIAKSALYPTLSFSAGLGSNYYQTSGYKTDGFTKQMKNNFNQYIGLNLNIPIFNRFDTRNNIRSAELNRINTQYQLDNIKKSLYKEIQQAYYNAVAAKAKYESSTEAKRSNEEAFTLMSAKYEFGKANITEFNEAKNNYLRSESELVRAKYEYMYQHSLLDFYRGRELRF